MRGKRVNNTKNRPRHVGVRPEEALRRAAILQAQANRLNPYPQPRGYVFMARIWEEYERWRRSESNPRLW